MGPASATQLAALLTRSEWMAAADEDLPTGHLARRIEARLNLGGKYEAASAGARDSLIVVAEATLRFVDDGQSQLEPRAAVMIEHEFESEATDTMSSVTQEVMNHALARVAESLVARLRLRQASHPELLAALSADDQEPALRTWALQLAAERGLREAVPAGIAALSADDEGLRTAAIAALVELGDPRAVPALGKGLDFKDYESVAVIVEAVSAIGGEEAVDFLEFVQSGHPDEDLRARAQAGIERLAGRK
jgi:HEAT repeat protein